MRIRIAFILISVAICLGMFTAAPATLHTFIVPGSNRSKKVTIEYPIPAVGNTLSPIRHLIVVVGENRSFDNVFGTYVPSNPTQTVWNLLSQDIVQINGNIGTNFEAAAQHQATDTTTYELSPTQTGHFQYLPQPSTTLNALPTGLCNLGIFCSDIGLDPTSQGLLSTRGTGQPFYDPPGATPVPDCRYPSDLPNGPYLLLGDSELNNCGQPFLAETIANTTYTSNTGDPVHRFYQMWQQSDCSVANITPENPSGCKRDLFTWVAVTVGWGFTNPPMTNQDTFQGGVAMGYYSMAAGDFPYFLDLAENYAISDNYHQPVMGGTGPNSQFLFTGDVYYFTDANGNPATPASNLVEDPNPRSGTNNFYNNDHFNLAADPGSTGVAFTNCSDDTQPGVQPIMSYLQALPYPPFHNGNCDSNHWYQLNNDYPNYTTMGTIISNQDVNEFPAGPAFSIGPQTIPTVGDALSAHNISWRYYGGGFSVASHDPPSNSLYCAICNGFQYATSIMTTSLRQNLVDLEEFHTYADHASILKFIEWNWNLQPLSPRRRDNLPNPTTSPNAPYFPSNSPAIGDLRTMFSIPQISSTPQPSPTPQS